MKRLGILAAAFALPLAAAALLLGSVSSAAAQKAAPGRAHAAALAPEAASIVITMTVGTSRSTCATSQSLTLPPGGGEAVYCYQVKNTGDVALSRHTLQDDRLGTILNSFPYNLVPNASAFLTHTAQVTLTTASTATWTAFNPGPTNIVAAESSALVEVTPAEPSIVLTQTVGTDTSTCATTSSIRFGADGGKATFCYTIRNTGNIPLTRHTLEDEAVGLILSQFPYTLVPGASAFITQTVQVTSTLANQATWTAFNPGPVDQVSDTGEARVAIVRHIYLPQVSR